MKSALDKLLYKNVTEFNEQLQALNEQEKTLSDDLKYTIKILKILAQEATEDQLELLTKVKADLKIHRVLLGSIAALFDYFPHPDLECFARQLQKDSLQLRSYLESFDKDPLGGRAPKLNKKGGTAKSTEQILAEQFDTSSLSEVVANVHNMADGSYLPALQQFNLAQQVVYINAVGKDFPLTINRRSTTNLTGLSREMLKNLADILIEQSNNPVQGNRMRVKAQLNLIAVMREQYYRCTGVFLNTTQILSVLLSLNDLHHNGFVELAADTRQYDTKAFFAAIQWVFKHQPEEWLAKEFKYKATKLFFASVGIPAEILETNITEEQLNTGIIKPELSGLSKAIDTSLLTYRMPSNGKMNLNEDSECSCFYSQEYLQRVSIALNMAEPGQPVLLIAQDAAHAIELAAQLAEYLKNENTEVELGTFIGVESDENRQVWFKENQLKQLKIAITIPELATSKAFNTLHAAGCFAIQTYINEPVEAEQLINNIMSFGKQNHFVALHEENRIISVQSRSLVSEKDKKSILESIQADKLNRNQERAVEQYYLQSAISIQRVALKQFDQWQAFLHLIYPRMEWRLLDKRLLEMRQEFIEQMEWNWGQLLLATDPMHQYPNPYIRRNAQNELDTLTLDKTVKSYEVNIDALWSRVQNEFKRMDLVSNIPPHSVNGLRCKYLEKINFQDELALDRLATRQNIKAQQRERKKASRLVKSALDVNGAMLRYAQGKVTPYRQPFLDRQLKLIALDICKQIRLSSLSSETKKVLIERTLHADNLVSLELMLIDYESRWSRQDRNSEKYRMQPIINELLRIHQFANVDANEQLLVLKNIYLDNAANDVIDDLEHALSWARKEKRGFGYFLERSAVQKAACDILNAVDDVKYAADLAMKKLALKTLYSTLTQHQAQLDGLWIFSFGHANTRDLINKNLYVLNDLTVIGSGKNELTIEFINECKEEAQSNLAKQKFNVVIKELENRNNSWLKNNKEWQAVITALTDIQRDNPTLYAIDEMHHLVSTQCNELHQSRSKLREPFIHLRGALRSLWLDVTHQHSGLLSESRHFELKREQLRKDLEIIPGYDVHHVELLIGTNGSGEYYDLAIKGNGSLPLLDRFTHYHSQLDKMKQERNELQSQLVLPTEQHAMLEQLINKQLPLVRSGKADEATIHLFSPELQKTVTEIIGLQHFATDSIDNVPQDIQNALEDRAVLRFVDMGLFFDKKSVDSLEAKQMLERIETINDSGLKGDLKQLYNKIHPPITEQPASSSWWSPKNWISNVSSGFADVASRALGTFLSHDSEEDWRYQFADLLDRPNDYLKKYFIPLADKKIELLTSELSSRKNVAADALALINGQLQFIDTAIEGEKAKSKALTYRFDSLGELYEFEKELRNYAAHAVMEAADAAVTHDDESNQLAFSEESAKFNDEEKDTTPAFSPS